jgi:drug/metabolite transporter (DMT)-like permease
MNINLKGALYVATGAASYGILATFVKYANNQGVGTAGLAFSQYLFGALVLIFLSFLFSKKQESDRIEDMSRFPKLKLVLYGGFLGLTTSFYYLSIQYVPVSVGIILLMQTIWMGVVVEFFMARHLINKTKIIGAVVALIGTALAAKLFESEIELDYRGIGYGLLAAASYTGVLYATSRVALEIPLFTRSKYLVFGGLLVILIFWNAAIFHEISWSVFLIWGSFLGLFGTILPPVLFSKGMPRVGTGFGSIISAIEIPISVVSAYLVLNEHISLLQWLGIVIILIAVVLINRNNV